MLTRGRTAKLMLDELAAIRPAADLTRWPWTPRTATGGWWPPIRHWPRCAARAAASRTPTRPPARRPSWRCRCAAEIQARMPGTRRRHCSSRRGAAAWRVPCRCDPRPQGDPQAAACGRCRPGKPAACEKLGWQLERMVEGGSRIAPPRSRVRCCVGAFAAPSCGGAHVSPTADATSHPPARAGSCGDQKCCYMYAVRVVRCLELMCRWWAGQRPDAMHGDKDAARADRAPAAAGSTHRPTRTLAARCSGNPTVPAPPTWHVVPMAVRPGKRCGAAQDSPGGSGHLGAVLDGGSDGGNEHGVCCRHASSAAPAWARYCSEHGMASRRSAQRAAL